VNTNRTLDLTSGLEVNPTTTHGSADSSSSQNTRSVLTIAFQFPFDSTMQENVVIMARQYVRSVISSVQRVAMAISPSGINPAVGAKLSPGSPEAVTLAQWICQSYRQVYIFVSNILSILVDISFLKKV
jgi:homeobox-leucine zipper protein